jgi:hypothetical protein
MTVEPASTRANRTFEDHFVFAITVRNGQSDEHPGIYRHASTGAGLADGRVGVSDRQITWLIDPEEQVQGAAVPPPPPMYGLGGISGGPLITWIESENYVTSYALGGIISEHPDYSENDFSIERVVACRADLITTTGRVIE